MHDHKMICIVISYQHKTYNLTTFFLNSEIQILTDIFMQLQVVCLFNRIICTEIEYSFSDEHNKFYVFHSATVSEMALHRLNRLVFKLGTKART